MVETWICPELGTNFTENFTVMLINHIYNNWSFTSETGILSGLNKPAIITGQNNTIDFKPGIPDSFKTLQVCALQDDTEARQPNGASPYMMGGQRAISFMTQVNVITATKIMGRDDTTGLLRKMEQEIVRQCGQYKQGEQTGNMAGIKQLFYGKGKRQYGPSDDSDKDDWSTVHAVVLWYELRDIS